MKDPAGWPQDAIDNVARFMASDDPVAVARVVLHEAAKLHAPTDVALDKSGQIALAQAADAAAVKAAEFIWNVGAPADAPPEVLEVALKTIAERVRAAIAVAQSDVLDRLLVRPDGSSTLGPPPREPTPEEVRRDRAARCVARILERECANLAPAERRLVMTVHDTCARGEDVDPSQAVALEQLLRKSHPLHGVTDSLDSVKAALERNADELTALIAEWRTPWDLLDAADREWLRQRVGMRLPPEDQDIAWSLHADACYRRFAGGETAQARTALDTWQSWGNVDLLNDAEKAWLGRKHDEVRQGATLSVDDALYVLECAAVHADGE